MPPANPTHVTPRRRKLLLLAFSRPASTEGWVRTAAVMGALALVLLAPQITGWPLLHAHKEDGEVFLAGALNDGVTALWTTYSGYLHVGPRLIAALAAALPLQYATVVIGVVTAAIRALLGVLATHAFTPYAASRRWALLAGSVVVLAPVGLQEALGNITNLRWFLVSGAVIALWGTYDRAPWAIGSAAVAALASLSDPLTIVLAPVAVLRLLGSRRGWRALPSATLLAGVALQVAALRPSARPPDLSGWLREPLVHAQQTWVRGITEAQLGQSGTEIVILVGTAWLAVAAGSWVVLLIILAHRASPDREAVLFAGSLVACGAAMVAATLTFSDLRAISLTEWWGVGQASRYAVIPSVIGGAGIVLLAGAATTSRPSPVRLVGWLSVVVLALAFAADLRGAPANSDGPTWSESLRAAQRECEDGPPDAAISIPLTPQHVPKSWVLRTTCGAVVGR